MSDTEGPSSGEPQERPAEQRTAERLQALETELGEAKDKLLRALAETENVRRRAQREREDVVRYGAANFARDMLTVADNLRRALEHAPEESAQDEVTRVLIAGVAATERELLAALERHGVRKIEPKPGDRFDHNLHEAMFEVETGQPAGLIVQVLQPGYLIHDRLLRPAMVGVAKTTGAPEAKRVDEVV